MPFAACWAPNYHASRSGNYSVRMAIRCQMSVKKTFFNCNLRYWAKRERCICTRKFLIFHPFVPFIFLRSQEKKKKQVSSFKFIKSSKNFLTLNVACK